MESIEIGKGCILTRAVYGKGANREVQLEYVERSPDSWHGDTETSIDISEEKAKEIIHFLLEAFDS